MATKAAVAKQELISAIIGGKFAPKGKLPGETRLSSQLGVSPITLRRTLNDLAREGLLVRIKGSGTYVNTDKSFDRLVSVTSLDLKRPFHKHFWGKLLEHIEKYPLSTKLKQVDLNDSLVAWQKRRELVKLFGKSDPLSLAVVTMNDLGGLVELGMCADLTDDFDHWPESRNIHAVAVEAVSIKKKIYAFPFHCSVSGLICRVGEFEQIGQSCDEAAGSLDQFVRTVERFSERTELEYTVGAVHIRMFLMHLLRGFYVNLCDRFEGAGAEPIEREVGLEVLEILHRLKWKYRAFIPAGFANERYVSVLFKSGKMPMYVGELLPRRFHSMSGGLDEGLTFVPLSFGPDGSAFSLFNGHIWIVNARAKEGVRQFLSHFLQDYIQPQTENELDRRYLEEGTINRRNNVFINSLPRIPADPVYDAARSHVFKIAQREIPYGCAEFDRFVLSACRILHDSEANLEREYDFYRSMGSARVQIET